MVLESKDFPMGKPNSWERVKAKFMYNQGSQEISQPVRFMPLALHTHELPAINSLGNYHT
jgi:hypothetical protein